MEVRNALEALTMRPTRFLISAWPWRSAMYLICGSVLGWLIIGGVSALLVTGLLLAVVVIGLVALAAIPLVGVLVGRLERWRMRLVDFDPLPDPHGRPDRPGVRAWLEMRLREQATWRELAYAMVFAGVFCWMDAVVVAGAVYLPLMLLAGPFYIDDEPLSVTLPLALAGIPLIVVMTYPVTAWAAARAGMARAILAPRSNDVDARLVDVTRSRARLVDAFEVERRRIERDLHDGAQQRLVALSMHLGLARLELPPGAPAAEPVAAAHELAKQALTELRELIRGVHPKILTDRGLAAAVEDVAAGAPMPVDLHLRIPRLAAAVEVAAYFVVVEALANVAKHSGASRATVAAWTAGGRLLLNVSDDGRGGADPGRGSGLTGLADRVAAVDGKVSLSSPPGGPTLLCVEIPCES